MPTTKEALDLVVALSMNIAFCKKQKIVTKEQEEILARAVAALGTLVK